MKRNNLPRANEIESQLKVLERHRVDLEELISCKITATSTLVTIKLEIDNRYQDGDFRNLFTPDDIVKFCSRQLQIVNDSISKLLNELEAL